MHVLRLLFLPMNAYFVFVIKEKRSNTKTLEEKDENVTSTSM